MLRACVAIERAGIPSVAITATEFAGMSRLIARHLGVDGIPLAVYPGVILTDSPAVFERKVAEDVVPALIAGLLDNRATTVLGQENEAEHAPSEVVLSGSYDEILDGFVGRGWSDGLPIVPPTVHRVEAFLRYTDRDPDEVVGVLLPASRAATVWNVAVNGVMAGCRPEHLPILLAVVEAVADPIFRIEDAGSTPGWEPMVILSGSLAEELGFNSAAGALRVGNRANTSIGRFLRLFMRNVAGLRPQPDETDKGAISYTFNVALAENEAAVQALGWQPYRVDRGFESTENVVTVRSVVTISAPIYTAGAQPADHLSTIARLMADAIGPWCYHNYIYEQQHPLLILGPGIAATIAAGGLTKDDVRRYLYDNVLVDGAWVASYAPGVSGKAFDWADLAARGKAPPEYATAATDGQAVRGFLRPEWTDILVAGNPGRNQSRGYIGNHGQGIPVSRAVSLPAAWDRLRREDRP